MLTAWRLVHKNYLISAFSGEGARLAGGRWNSEGFPVVYTAGSLSLAMLEIIVHLEFKETLTLYKALQLSIPSKICEQVDVSRLPPDWNDALPHPASQIIGNRWIQMQRSAVLEVPSAIVPAENNFLLNPSHADFGRIRIGDPIDLPVDPRVLSKLK